MLGPGRRDAWRASWKRFAVRKRRPWSRSWSGSPLGKRISQTWPRQESLRSRRRQAQSVSVRTRLRKRRVTLPRVSFLDKPDWTGWVSASSRSESAISATLLFTFRLTEGTHREPKGCTPSRRPGPARRPCRCQPHRHQRRGGDGAGKRKRVLW